MNTFADVNVAQLVGTQDGRVIVPLYARALFSESSFERFPREILSSLLGEQPRKCDLNNSVTQTPAASGC